MKNNICIHNNQAFTCEVCYINNNNLSGVTVQDVAIQAQLDGLFIPENPREYTKKDIVLLNMEMTPEIQAKLDDMLAVTAKADAETYTFQHQGIDKERQLQENFSLFEAYIAISKKRGPLQDRWEAIRGRKSTWWSFFHEEMEANWTKYVQFTNALDKRMDKLAKGQAEVLNVASYVEYITGDEVIMQPRLKKAVVLPKIHKAKWAKAMALKEQCYAYCLRVQEARRKFTYSIFSKAMQATKEAKAFWSTPVGQELNRINDLRSSIWEQIQQLDVNFWDYNNYLNEELNPYWTKSGGDSSEEKLASDSYEALNIIRDEHIQEMKEYNKPAKGIGFWDFQEERACKEAHLHEEFKRKTMADLTKADQDYNKGFEAFIKELDKPKRVRKVKKLTEDELVVHYWSHHGVGDDGKPVCIGHVCKGPRPEVL